MKTATACPAGRLRTARHYRMGGLRASPAGSIRPISGPDSACGGAAGVRHLQNLRLFQRYHLPRGNGQPFGVPLAFPLATVIPGLVPGIHGGGDPCRCPRAEGVSAGRCQIPGTSPGMTRETISGPDNGKECIGAWRAMQARGQEKTGAPKDAGSMISQWQAPVSAAPGPSSSGGLPAWARPPPWRFPRPRREPCSAIACRVPGAPSRGRGNAA